MGYYTYHSLNLEFDESKYDECQIISDLRETYEDAEFAFDENGDSQEEAKWYDSDEDLREFSKKYPDILFILSGEGEEHCDIWKLYALNGKLQKEVAEIIIAEFDPAKLS